MTERNPHGPTLTTSQRRAAKAWLGVLGAVLALGIALVGSWVYPWPAVTTTGEPVLIQAPTPGGELTFRREQVCIPAGDTKVDRFLESAPADDGSRVAFQFDSFTIDRPTSTCIAPNISRILIPEYAQPGLMYRVRLVSTTTTPTIWTAVNVSYSPWFTVAEPS